MMNASTFDLSLDEAAISLVESPQIDMTAYAPARRLACFWTLDTVTRRPVMAWSAETWRPDPAC